MQAVVLLVTTSIVFLAADAIMLRFVMQPLFQSHLGDQLAATPRLPAIVLFYIIYMAGIMWFAAWPALRDDLPDTALLNGAMLGLVAYGTYEMTSWAVMRDWSPAMVATDIAWGTALTAVAAWVGVMAARAVG